MGKLAYGIDIGASAIKVVLLDLAPGGSVLRNCATLPLEGREFGPAEAGRLKELLAQRGMKVKRAAVSIAGKDMVLDVTALPSAPSERLGRMVSLYVGQFGERHEDPLAHDWGLLPVPTAPGRDELTALVAMAREPYLDQIRTALEAAGVGVEAFVPAPIAAYNAYVKCAGASEGITYVIDLGERSLSVAILKGSSLLFARTIQGGLELFIEPLMGALEVKRARALRYLVEEGRVGARDDQETTEYKAGRALAGAAVQLAQMLTSSLKFCQVKTRIARVEPDRYLLCGGGARLRGLAEHLVRTTGKPVQLMDLGEGLPTDRLSEAARGDYADGLTFVGAVGAAQVGGGGGVLPVQLRTAAMRRATAFYSRDLVMALSVVASALLIGMAGFVASLRLEAERQRDRHTSEQFKQYKDRRDKQAELDAVRTSLEAKIALVLDRVEPGSRYFRALALIQSVLPDPIWVRNVALDTEKSGTVERRVLVVHAVVEESELTVTTVEKLFETALATNPLVRRTEFVSRQDDVAAGRTEVVMKIHFDEGTR